MPFNKDPSITSSEPPVDYDEPDSFDHPGLVLADTPEAQEVHDLDCLAPIPDFAKDKDRCDPSCKGWAVFERNDGGELQVEKCDACGVFISDDDVLPYALAAGIKTTPEYPFLVIKE